VVLAYYTALWQAGAGVDVVPVTADLSGYDVGVAPLLHLLKGDVARRLEDVVARGGSILTTFWSGRVDEDDNAFLADVPGPLGSVLGLRVEETDSAEPGVVNPVTLAGGMTSEASLVFELLVPQGAEVVGTYGADFYAGTAAVTRNRPDGPDGGEAWYVGTGLDAAGVGTVVRDVLGRHGLVGPYADLHDVEHAVRVRDGERYSFLLSHALHPVEVVVHASGTDLLTGRRVEQGDTLRLEPAAVLLIHEKA
jgi:beta-galactosidase